MTVAHRSISGAVSEQTVFFSLIVIVTAIPLLFFPIAIYVFPENTNIEHTRALLLFLGSSGHVASSFFFYGDPRMRAFMRREGTFRYFAAPAILLGLGVLVYTVMDATARAYVIVGFWIWQTHHFTRQNQGILSFVSRSESKSVAWPEAAAITLTGVAAIFGMITFVTPFQETVLAAYGWHLHWIASALFAAGWIFYLVSLLRERDLRSRPWRNLVLTVLMLFYAPLFLFENAFCAVFTYLAAHGLQYLVFMRFVATPRGAPSIRQLGVLVAWIVLGGLLLQLMRGDEVLLGLDGSALYGFAFGLLAWHFILDAGVWRLSEPFQRSYMSERFGFLRPSGREGEAGRS